MLQYKYYLLDLKKNVYGITIHVCVYSRPQIQNKTQYKIRYSTIITNILSLRNHSRLIEDMPSEVPFGTL